MSRIFSRPVRLIFAFIIVVRAGTGQWAVWSHQSRPVQWPQMCLCAVSHVTDYQLANTTSAARIKLYSVSSRRTEVSSQLTPANWLYVLSTDRQMSHQTG